MMSHMCCHQPLTVRGRRWTAIHPAASVLWWSRWKLPAPTCVSTCYRSAASCSLSQAFFGLQFLVQFQGSFRPYLDLLGLDVFSSKLRSKPSLASCSTSDCLEVVSDSAPTSLKRGHVPAAPVRQVCTQCHLTFLISVNDLQVAGNGIIDSVAIRAPVGVLFARSSKPRACLHAHVLLLNCHLF